MAWILLSLRRLRDGIAPAVGLVLVVAVTACAFAAIPRLRDALATGLLRTEVSDARGDQRWDPAASIVQSGVREAICVPMQGRYRVVGVIYIDTLSSPSRVLLTPGNKFNEEHLRLMIAIAHQAALAVAMSRLSERARNAAVLDERARLAGQIHDTLAQQFRYTAAHQAAA